jgi:uncharacterized membrane protein YccF (DUF307 family)
VSSTQMTVREPGMPLLLRILYFFLFGWWAAGVWISAAWVLNVTILGLPLGLWMLNRVPQVLTLRPMKQTVVAFGEGGEVRLAARSVSQQTVVGFGEGGEVRLAASSLPQHTLPVRALYFVLIGWWLSLVWAVLAWGLSLTIIGLPFAIWMFNRLPALTTLMRS